MGRNTIESRATVDFALVHEEHNLLAHVRNKFEDIRSMLRIEATERSVYDDRPRTIHGSVQCAEKGHRNYLLCTRAPNRDLITFAVQNGETVVAVDA